MELAVGMLTIPKGLSLHRFAYLWDPHYADPMCGIAGSTRDWAGTEARAMNAAMVHRGPDDDGIFVDPDCGLSLAARRLAVIDVEGGHQPVTNEARNIWAVLNGEIYNHRTLRDQLIRHGHMFASSTDTEVLVHLYEEYGDELVERLEGMFAFAVWDTRHRKLLLGRDRFGEKPLFYSERSDRIVFASEITALRAALQSVPAIDPCSMDAYFVMGYVPGARTAFKGIRQLEPASVLRWSAGRPRAVCSVYWRPPTEAIGNPRHAHHHAEETRARLEAAVASRLAADVPVGIFLSGGLDSNLVAALAREQTNAAIQTFTVGYDMGEFNEGDRARAAASLISSEHHEVTLRSGEVEALVPKLVRALDQPLADPAIVPLNYVAAAARERVTVALGGEGADEIFGGYPRYRWMERASRVGAVLPPRMGLLAERATRSGPGRIRRLGDVLRPASLTERHVDWVGVTSQEDRRHFYGPRLAGMLQSRFSADDAASILATERRASVAGSLMRLDQRRYLPDDVLAKADRSTMQVSLEMRTPYLERSLVEFASTVHSSVHLGGPGKALLRAVAETIPTVARSSRAKTAFRVPIAQWLRGPLREMLVRQVHVGPLVSDGWIDANGLRRLADEHEAATHDHGKTLWTILVAGLWLEGIVSADATKALTAPI